MQSCKDLVQQWAPQQHMHMLKNTFILPFFHDNLFYYRRYIDDIFGIWVSRGENPELTWEVFKHQLDNWGTLRWKVEEPSDHTTFLDLNIMIKDSSLKFSRLNLYLYLLPLSAHPISCLKGLIKGEMNRFWTQNDTKGFEELTSNFIERLHKRGYSIESLSPLFIPAANSLERNTKESSDNSNNNTKTLFIHWMHHLNGLKNATIRKIFNDMLQPFLNYDKTLIAIARPRNLKDTLTRAALSLPDSQTIQHHINTITKPMELQDPY